MVSLSTFTASPDDPLDPARFTRWVVDATGHRCAESSLRLSGLHCAGCVGTVEAVLLRVDGVLHAVADLSSRRATVRWDPKRTSASAIVEAVARAGYEAVPDLPDAARALRRAESRTAMWRLFVAAFCAMQVMMLAAPGYVAAPGEMAPDMRRLLDWGSWLMTLPVLLFSAAPFFRGAWHALTNGRIGMDVPVALGIAVTFAASSVAMADPAGLLGSAVYFDSLTMFVSFLLLGRWLELRMRHRAAEALEATVGAMPQTALRMRPDGRDEVVAIGRLVPGDSVRVPLGHAFPADGVVIQGRTEADESLLNGESRPVRKTVGSAVVGGTLNLAAPVAMRVERCGKDTRYEAIVGLMRDAATQRPDVAKWADRWAAPFLWAVLLLAALGAAVWSVVDPSRSVWVAVSVLIVTCPCALSLATPSALLAAAQKLARDGVLVRRLDALETLAGIDRLFLDKTGTLTTQRPFLSHVDRFPASGMLDVTAVMHLGAALAVWSQHPLSRALVAAVPASGSGEGGWHDVREVTGAGVEARDDEGRLWRLGMASWTGRGAPSDGDQAGLSATLSRDGEPIARFNFDEKLSDGASAAVIGLREDGVALGLLSGDTPARVERLAQRLGIDVNDAVGAATPARKLQEVERAQRRGERVGMVGDGVNDAPVLARADVSFAMGEGALIARANADAVIVSNHLGAVLHARRTAQRMLRVIRQNIAWAAAYNAVCVPLALFGALPPWAAGLGMAASSLLVVANSMRLQRGG